MLKSPLLLRGFCYTVAMPATVKTLRRNIHFLYALDFFANSAFTLPIYILFGREYLHLSYFQAGSFFLVSWFVSIFLDFAGGVVSDRIGRKQAYLYGVAIQALTLIPFLVTKSYPLLLASSVITGIGVALSSSSIDALIYEQASALGEKSRYQHANATTQVFVFMGRIYASVLGGFLYHFDPRLPYVVYGLVLLLAIFAGASIRVDKKIDEEHVNHLETIKTALRVYRRSKALVKFLVIGAFFALWADMLFGYLQPYFIQLHTPSLALGVLFSFISVASATGSFMMRKLPNKLTPHTIQSLELIGVMATAALLLILKLPVVFVAPLFMGLISGFMYPNMRLYVNSHADNAARASVLSFASTAFNVGTGLGFVLSFWLPDHAGVAVILGIILGGAGVTLIANHLWKPEAEQLQAAA